MIYERPFRQCVPQSVVYPRNPSLYITMNSPSTLNVPLASGQRKISMATPTVEKVKNQIDANDATIKRLLKDLEQVPCKN